MAALDDDCGRRKFERIGKEPEQCQVGPAVDRRRGETDFQGIAMQSGTSSGLRAGLDVEMQCDAAVVADAKPFVHRNIRTACSSRMAISGERSMPEMSGTKRRIGSRIGLVSWLAGAANGEWGLIHDNTACTTSAPITI